MKTMKRLASVLLVLVMVLGMVSMTAGAATAELEFDDILNYVDLDELLVNYDNIAITRVVLENFEDVSAVKVDALDCFQMSYNNTNDWWGVTTGTIAGETVTVDSVVIQASDEMDAYELAVKREEKTIYLPEFTEEEIVTLETQLGIDIPENLPESVAVPYTYIRVTKSDTAGGADTEIPSVDTDLTWQELVDRTTMNELLAKYQELKVVRVVMGEELEYTGETVEVDGVTCLQFTYNGTEDYWGLTTAHISESTLQKISAGALEIDAQDATDIYNVTVAVDGTKTITLPQEDLPGELQNRVPASVEIPYIRIEVDTVASCKVSFRYNDGADRDWEDTVLAGTTVRVPDPTREGYEFEGWFVGEDEADLSNGYVVNEETVFIAKWKEAEADDPVVPDEKDEIKVRFWLTDDAYWTGTLGNDRPWIVKTTGADVEPPVATDFEGPADRAFLYWIDKNGNKVDGFTYEDMAELAKEGKVDLYTKFETVVNETITVMFYIPWGEHGDFYVDNVYEGNKYTVYADEDDTVIFPEVDTDRGYKVTGWVVEGWKTWSLDRWTDSLSEVGWYADRDDELYIYPVIEKVHTSHVRLDKKNHDAYIEGYGDDTVRPENNITRAEIATIFYRLLTDGSREQYKTSVNSFSDVNKGDWYNTAVSTMANAGVMDGYPDGTFRPDAAITRAELAAVVSRFVDWEDYYDCYFYDVGKWHWAWDEIALARYLGWIEGYGDGSYRPDAKITRAETVTLVNRVLERAVESKHDMCKGMITFDDCVPDDWFYEEIQEAANSHTYRRTDEKVPGLGFYYEEWGRLLN